MKPKRFPTHKRETLIVFADKTVRLIETYPKEGDFIKIKVSEIPSEKYTERIFKPKLNEWILSLPFSLFEKWIFDMHLEDVLTSKKIVINATEYTSAGQPIPIEAIDIGKKIKELQDLQTEIIRGIKKR